MGIIAYDVDKAKEEFEKGRDPLDISIEKWEDIERVLKLLELEMKDMCGLCFEYGSSDCTECHLFERRDKSCIEDQLKGMSKAVDSTRIMVRKLKSLRK